MVPPHIDIDLSEEDQRFLIKNTKSRFIRWTNQFDKKDSKFWYIIKDSFEGFDELSTNTRSKVRRGNKRLYAQPVEFQFVRENGYQTYINAFQSYNTFEKPMTETHFYEYITKLENSGQYELWGCWDKLDNKLAGFSENFLFDDTCFYETIFLDPFYLKYYSSYVLFYEMNKYYLQKKGFRYVHDGSLSLSHETGVQDFLISKFKFRKAFCNLCIAYRRDIYWLANALYPMRSFVYKGNDHVRKKIAVLLRHEEIRRSS